MPEIKHGRQAFSSKEVSPSNETLFKGEVGGKSRAGQFPKERQSERSVTLF